MSSDAVLQESDIIFPSAHNSIHTTLGELKRRNLSIKHRLRSIASDAAFVNRISRLGLPLIANERCGSWYIHPADKAGSAYFKSTDGHHGQWSFSLRRLNLHLLDIIAEHGGCIIVDSTRRGKSMPDALSKTMPIWIAVMNKLLFPDITGAHDLHTPPGVVSRSEHAQIADRIEQFVQQALSLGLDTAALRLQLSRPMRPYWVTPDTDLPNYAFEHDYHRVVLCTASSQASRQQATDAEYVQGAADDQESWACGLDPATFWHEKDVLLEADEDELPDLIRKLVSGLKQHPVRLQIVIHPTSQVAITDLHGALQDVCDKQLLIHCSSSSDPGLRSRVTAKGGQYVHLVCGDGKIGSRQLRHELPKTEVLSGRLPKGDRILCVCPSGRDLAVGVALTMICRYFDEDGRSRAEPHTPNKDEIKRKLTWIMVSTPDAAPSRATLQSVNSYLMS